MGLSQYESHFHGEVLLVVEHVSLPPSGRKVCVCFSIRLPHQVITQGSTLENPALGRTVGWLDFHSSFWTSWASLIAKREKNGDFSLLPIKTSKRFPSFLSACSGMILFFSDLRPACGCVFILPRFSSVLNMYFPTCYHRILGVRCGVSPSPYTWFSGIATHRPATLIFLQIPTTQLHVSKQAHHILKSIFKRVNITLTIFINVSLPAFTLSTT